MKRPSIRPRRAPPGPEGFEHVLEKRAKVAEAIVLEFAGKEFVWGDRDCACLAHRTLRGLGLKSPFSEVPRYSTERGALKGLRRLGFRTLSAVVDSLGFEPIAPSMCLPADLLAFPAAGGAFDVSLGVALSGGRAIVLLDDSAPAAGGRASVISGVQDALRGWRVKV